MKPDYYNKISQASKQSGFHQSASLQSFRNPRPIISFSPENDRVLLKSKDPSPKGWLDWNEGSTPRAPIQSQNSIKLPPIDIDIKRSQHVEASKEPFNPPQTEKKTVFKARGSILLESPLTFPRGSIITTIPEDLQLKSIPEYRTNQYIEESKKKFSVKPEDSSVSLKKRVETFEIFNGSRKNTIKFQDSSYFTNVISRCGYKTQTGSTMGKKKKHNQDNWIISQKLQGMKGQYLLAVCDGHGDKGHKVSSLIRQHLPLKVEESLSEYISPGGDINALFAAGIRSTVTTIEGSGLDLNFSGSTLAALLIRGNKAIVGNIGDSRVVVGSRDSHGRWQASDLSSDQKPTRADEAARVLNAGGVIRPFQSVSGESAGPLRVWSKERNVPGLAMTRSIGDLASKGNGIISEPEITSRVLRHEDKFVILATDGVWEFVSSQEAVDIVKEVWAQGKSEACCEKLLVEAQRRWEDEGVVDDITVLVAFINVKNH